MRLGSAPPLTSCCRKPCAARGEQNNERFEAAATSRSAGGPSATARRWPGPSTVTEAGLLDQRRALDAVARRGPRRSKTGTSWAPSAKPTERRAASGAASPLPVGDPPRLGLGRHRDRGHQVVDDLDDLAGMLKPKRASCASWKRLPERLGWSLGEALEGDRQLELVVLAEIAHLERAGDIDVVDVALLLELRRRTRSTSSPRPGWRSRPRSASRSAGWCAGGRPGHRPG